VAKVKNIYDVDGYTSFKKAYDKDKTKFLLFKHDLRSFERLEKIIELYPDKIDQVQNNGKVKSIDISPFELYRRDHGMVTKYSKKDKGPVIKQLKYLDKKLITHIDITPNNAKNKHVILQSLSPWRTDVYFNDETNEYEIMGIKYSDLKFHGKGKYEIKRDRYLEIKKSEQVSDNSEFVFTLYRKDRIRVKNLETSEMIETLFWSRSTSNKWYAELKPIDKFECLKNDNIPIYGKANGRIIKRLIPKNCKIWKVNTSILGDTFSLEKESEMPKDLLD